MNDFISRKAVEKIIKEFFKTKVDEIPKREKFNKLCDLCDVYLELNADLHKEIEDIPTAYDVDKVVDHLIKRFDFCQEMAEKNDKAKLEEMAFSWRQVANGVMDAIDIVKGAVKDE